MAAGKISKHWRPSCVEGRQSCLFLASGKSWAGLCTFRTCLLGLKCKCLRVCPSACQIAVMYQLCWLYCLPICERSQNTSGSEFRPGVKDHDSRGAGSALHQLGTVEVLANYAREWKTLGFSVRLSPNWTGFLQAFSTV